ncbi:MAG: AAA family ATPase [Oscillatoria sp. SIO1A7]|nr:AAA family ATPase [Oscillatoria sp. SIO1A7]
MKVKRLKMRAFRAIADLTLEFDTDGPIVLIGINGTGKTSILDCIRILLSYFVVRILFEAYGQGLRIQRTRGTTIYVKKEDDFSNEDIKQGSNKTTNEIELSIDGQQVKWSVTAAARQGEQAENVPDDLPELTSVADNIFKSWKEDEAVNIPLVAYYPVNRSVMDIPLEIPRQEPESPPIEAYDEAITGIPVSFKSFFQWFRVREDLENEERRDDIDYRDKQLEAVRQAIYSLLGEEDFKKLRVRRKPLRMTISKQGEELSINQLSDGEKCLLAMVGDWARRLAIANPSLENPLEGQGVLLIDEIELHLHPAWQRKIIPALTKTFPNCQLIVTTHSPQVVSHIKPEGIYILKTTPEGTVAERPAYSFGRDSNQILEDLMEIPERPLEIKQSLREIFRAIGDKDLDSARQLIQEIAEEIGQDEPELVKARTSIRRREILRK